MIVPQKLRCFYKIAETSSAR